MINYNIKKLINLIGDWGLGIGDWAQSPIPIPIPNITINNLLKIYINKQKLKLNVFLILYIIYI